MHALRSPVPTTSSERAARECVTQRCPRETLVQIEALAPIHQLVAFKAGVFTGFANQGKNRHEHLGGEEDDRERHALEKASGMPRFLTRKLLTNIAVPAAL